MFIQELITFKKAKSFVDISINAELTDPSTNDWAVFFSHLHTLFSNITYQDKYKISIMRK